MALRSLLKKEALWVRRNLVTLAFILLLLPGVFGYATAAFEQVIPRDAPVAIVAESDDVTENEMNVVRGAMTLFSEPKRYESEDAAFRALKRETVYGVVTVPHGMFEDGQKVTVRLYVESAIVSYEQPSIAISNVLRYTLRRTLPDDAATVGVERISLGDDRSLSEFLLPVGTMVVMMIFALAYLPYNLTGEERVFRRVRVETSLTKVLASKLAVFTLLMVVPLVTFQGVASYLGYHSHLLRPGAVGIYLLTFLYLAAFGAGTMFWTKFATIGRFLNVVVLFGLLTFSNMVYPPGFFSPLRREIARLVPVHYSMIIARGVSLKDVPIGLHADRVAMLVGVTVLALAWLFAAMTYYERTV